MYFQIDFSDRKISLVTKNDSKYYNTVHADFDPDAMDYEYCRSLATYFIES